MDQSEIQKKIEDFLRELDIPSFIVFGFQKNTSTPLSAGSSSDEGKKSEFGIVSSYNKVPPPAVIKGVSWALNDFISKSL